MKVIITANGSGTRFKNIGLVTPKYKLIAKSKPLFYWSLISLKNLFDEEFIFIFNNEVYDEQFVNYWINQLGIKKFTIRVLSHKTDGQASTVYEIRDLLNSQDSILIWNIDTNIDSNFINKQDFKNDGNLTVFKALGDHWSFVKVDNNTRAIATSEKIRISEYACTGLYYFNSWNDFLWVYRAHKAEIIAKYKEMYVAPMYQFLIDNGKHIGIHLVPLNAVICLGTPAEVKEFDKNYLENNN